MGRRIDVVLLTGPVIFILEFKVGETKYPAYAFDQVWDYALDLKNFHETSHLALIAPILISTEGRKICVRSCPPTTTCSFRSNQMLNLLAK